MTRPLKKPDAILFDWDGTLIDSLPALQSYYNHVLGAFSMPLISLEEARARIRLSARDVFPKLFGDEWQKAFDLYYDCVAKTHLDHLVGIDHSHDTLARLAEMKIPMGVVSNKRHVFLLKEIAHLGWDKYLVANVGAGEAAKDKPAPDPLLMAIDQLHLSPDVHEIWYVGDTETDMIAAVAARCQPIFIEHGLGTREECLRQGLEPYVFKGFSDLLAEVEKFSTERQ